MKKIYSISMILIFTIIILTMRFWQLPVQDFFQSTLFIMILTCIAIIAALVGYIFSKRAITVDNDPNLIHREQDRASFKQFSNMNIALIISFYSALVALLFVLINTAPLWLGIVAIINLMMTIIMRYYGYSMINKLYPEKDLPETFEQDFDDKLIDALNKEEMITIFTGLYNAFKMMNILIPISLILISLYGYHTGISQQFTLFVVTMLGILINVVYQLTVRKLI